MDWVGPPPVVSGFYCKICDLTFPDQRNFNLHRADTLHLQRCYQMEYELNRTNFTAGGNKVWHCPVFGQMCRWQMNQPASFATDARQLLALYSNVNTRNVASTPPSFPSSTSPHGSTGGGIRKRFSESAGPNFNIKYTPQSGLLAAPQNCSKKPKLADKPAIYNEELTSPSLSLSPSSSIGSSVCSVSEKKLAVTSTSVVNNSLDKVGHTNTTLKATLSKIKSLMGSLEKYKLLPKSAAIAASLDLNVLDEEPGQGNSDGGMPNEVVKSSDVSVNNKELSWKSCETSKGNISLDYNQVHANQLPESFISPKSETSKSMVGTTSADHFPDTLGRNFEENSSPASTVNKLLGKPSLNIFEKFSTGCQKNKTATSNPAVSARKSSQGSFIPNDISQTHATIRSNDSKATASKLTLLPTPLLSPLSASGLVSSSEIKKPLLQVPIGALLPEVVEATKAKSPVAIHSDKLVSLQENLKKTLESCGRLGNKKALTEEQVKDLEVNEMLILINTIMTKIIQDITRDRPSKFSVKEVLDCGINQRGDLFMALEKLFGRDKPQQLTELVKALKSIDPKVLQGLKDLLEKDQEPAKSNDEKETCSSYASTIPRGTASAKGDGLLNRPDVSTYLKNGSTSQFVKVASGKHLAQPPREARALLPTPRGALLPTPNPPGP